MPRGELVGAWSASQTAVLAPPSTDRVALGPTVPVCPWGLHRLGANRRKSGPRLTEQAGRRLPASPDKEKGPLSADDSRTRPLLLGRLGFAGLGRILPPRSPRQPPNVRRR